MLKVLALLVYTVAVVSSRHPGRPAAVGPHNVRHNWALCEIKFLSVNLGFLRQTLQDPLVVATTGGLVRGERASCGLLCNYSSFKVKNRFVNR